MIRPCLCAGSLAHVHLDCLNQWRSTSESAYSSCSICHFHYRVKKNFVSAVLLQPAIIMLVVFLIFVIGVVISGFILQFGLKAMYPRLSVTKTDVIEYLYDIQLPNARFCRLPNRYEMVSATLNSWKPNAVLFKLSVNIWIWIACNPITCAIMEAFLLGCPIIGSAGHLIHNYRIIRQAMGGNQQGWAGLVNVSFLWFGNDIPFMVRLYTIMGCFIFLKDIRDDYSIALRNLSHRMGNEVMNVDD